MGNLYVADLGNARVRVIAANGIITTVAGGGSLAPGGANEGTAATLIALAAPRNIALDGYGALYFSDFSAQRVYRVDLGAGGALTTIAGSGTVGVGGDNGLATLAQLNYPAGLVFDRNRALYIADSQNHLIRKVAGGIISSFARAATPTGLAIDAFGTLYAADPGAGQILAFPLSGPATALATPRSILPSRQMDTCTQPKASPRFECPSPAPARSSPEVAVLRREIKAKQPMRSCNIPAALPRIR